MGSSGFLGGGRPDASFLLAPGECRTRPLRGRAGGQAREPRGPGLGDAKKTETQKSLL